jgi:hypothetical protein
MQNNANAMMNNLSMEQREQILNQRDEALLLEIIRNYKRNRNYMLIFMLFQMVFDILCNTWNIKQREQNYQEMTKFYGMLSTPQIHIFF